MGESLFALGLQERVQCLHELTSFTETCQAELNNLFEALGWNPEANTTTLQMEVCPYDPNHTVPLDRMEKHKAACRLTQLGYSKEEQAEMYDPSIFYEKTSIASIVLDTEAFQQVILQNRNMGSSGLLTESGTSTDLPEVPQNHKRQICDLSIGDRLAIYDHVMDESNQRSENKESNNEDLYVDHVAKLKKGEKLGGPKSHLEVLAEMRDYRRRRQSYRAKNVHITKKSYTEVIREVIDVHSEELCRIWQEEKDEESRASRHSSRREESVKDRSASIESRDSRVSTRDGHSHKKHRKRSRKRSRERKRKHERDSKSPDAAKRHKKKKKHKSD